MAEPPALPSGKQYAISHAGQRAVVTEVGAGLRLYNVDGHDVLEGYGEKEMCPAARGAALIPWPNRLADGRYVFRGRTYQTPLSEPEKHNAIHGLTRWMNWEARRHDSNLVTMGLRLHAQPGYPFILDLEIEYRLTDEGLRAQTTVRNAGEEPLPYGGGHHPYVNADFELVDEARLRLPALLRIEVDQRVIPTGKVSRVEGTPYDFLEPRQIGATRLDTAFTGLLPDAQGVTRLEVYGRQPDRPVRLWMDTAYPYVMVFTADTLEEVPRRRRSLGLEPMTCAPNAFQTGEGLRILEPGQTFSHAWGLVF